MKPKPIQYPGSRNNTIHIIFCATDKWQLLSRFEISLKYYVIVKVTSKSRDEINHFNTETTAKLPAVSSRWLKTQLLWKLSNKREQSWPLSRETGGQVCMAEWRRSAGYPSVLERGSKKERPEGSDTIYSSLPNWVLVGNRAGKMCEFSSNTLLSNIIYNICMLRENPPEVPHTEDLVIFSQLWDARVGYLGDFSEMAQKLLNALP